MDVAQFRSRGVHRPQFLDAAHGVRERRLLRRIRRVAVDHERSRLNDLCQTVCWQQRYSYRAQCGESCQLGDESCLRVVSVHFSTSFVDSASSIEAIGCDATFYGLYPCLGHIQFNLTVRP